jgi:SpoVK/Ycf46/Vps4 family AAA+-type ATPase
MNQLQPDRVNEGGISPQSLDYFSLPVYEHFNGKPFHVFRIYQQWDVSKILKDCKSSVIRSRQSFDPLLPEHRRERAVAVLLQMDDVFCYIESQWLLCYASSPEIARKRAMQMIKRYAKPVKKDEPKFHILSLRSDSLEIEAVKMAKPFKLGEEELQLHYGTDAPEFERYLTGAWDTGVAGLTIFRGPPGTGKTSYIRHLITKLQQTHRFYYLPLDAVRYLSSPDMVDFWLRINNISTECKKIVVLEDAEDLLMERGADNRAKVSALLNIGDGLMSDYLQLHLLCTVNCPMDKLDPAITRPGRLTAVREFRRLDRKQAERIANVKAIALPDQDDYSLAEIYRGNQWRDDQQAGKKIGFAVS